MLVTDIALALAMMQAPQVVPPDPSAARSSVRARPLGSLVRPEQLVLRGPHNTRDLRLAIPRSARALPGSLDLGLVFSGEMLAGSNVQVFVNNARRALVERRAAGADGRTRVAVPLRAEDLAGGLVAVRIETRLPTIGDRCSDAERSSAQVRIDPASAVTLHLDSRAGGPAQYDVDALAQQLTIAVAGRAMPAAEFDTVLAAAVRLTGEGHALHFVSGGTRTLIASTQADISPADLVRSSPPDVRPRPINPSLPELDVAELQRDFERETTWRIPLDMRLLPAGRIPDRLVLKMVVAPDQLDDLLDVRVYLNDFLLRPVDVLADGTRRTIRVSLPADELNIYNEVRVVAQRVRASLSSCATAQEVLPAQLQDDSYLVTTPAPGRPRQFSTFIGALPAAFDVYLPQDAAMHAEILLPLLLSAERSFWGPRRHARIRYYSPGMALALEGPSIVVQEASGSETVVRLIRVDGHPVMSVTPALNGGVLPDVPDAYVNTDSIAFDVTGLGRGARIVAARDNTGTVNAIRFALEYRLWVVLATLMTLSAVFVLYARTRRPVRPSRS